MSVHVLVYMNIKYVYYLYCKKRTHEGWLTILRTHVRRPSPSWLSDSLHVTNHYVTYLLIVLIYLLTTTNRSCNVILTT
jgi:hypothetical protein